MALASNVEVDDASIVSNGQKSGPDKHIFSLGDLMPISSTNAFWKCPVCRTEVKSDGAPFTSLWSCSLHVASKAKTDRRHMGWIRRVEPAADRSNWTNNELAEVIQDAVSEAQNAHPVSSGETSGTLHPREELGRLGSRVEADLKVLITATLSSHYGEGHWCNSDWFVNGIPIPVQKKCLEKRIEQRSVEPPLNFATLLEFLSIIESKNWPLFDNALRAIGFRDKKSFQKAFRRFNCLRNLTHGARDVAVSEQDIEDARRFADQITSITKDVAGGSG